MNEGCNYASSNDWTQHLALKIESPEYLQEALHRGFGNWLGTDDDSIDIGEIKFHARGGELLGGIQHSQS